MIIIGTLILCWLVWSELRIQRLTDQIDHLLYVDPQQGNLSRKWKGYCKIKPEDHKTIFEDLRSCAEIAKDYNVSTSHISHIKRNYKDKIKTCWTQ